MCTKQFRFWAPSENAEASSRSYECNGIIVNNQETFECLKVRDALGKAHVFN